MTSQPDADPGDVEAAVRGFVRRAAHDLAQPLQVAYGYLELLRDQYGDDLPGDAGVWLASAIRSLDRSRLFVREMLRYSRVESPTLSPIDLAAAASQAVGNIDPDLPSAEVVVATELPTVAGDGTQLTMVFEALIDNAIRHGAPTDDRAPRVDVTADRSQGWCTVTVADAGPGIPLELRAKVLEPFERGAGTARPGLGLTIARLIIANHGGRLWIDERPTGGAAVRFTVPG